VVVNGLASSRAALGKLALAFAFGAAAWTPARVDARQSADALPTVAIVTLPQEAQKTAALIRTGGPFPHAKDGTVFGNRERLLPQRPRGQYREYTVPTPGARDRGARRIVCAGSRPVDPEVCYYTADHYASFARIAP
jgi:ribonuclease T1